MTKPPRLNRGDTIGVVSPSWGGAGLFPHRIDNAVGYLRSLGFETRLGRHARNQRGFVSDTAKNRAADIHEMFLAPEVKAIVAAAGGDHSCHLLPLLDFDLIRRHPKIFMGYSDITVLNLAIWKETGLVTFNGPVIMSDFGEYPRMLQYTERSFLRTVCSAAPVDVVKPAETWTEDFLDWGTKQDVTRPRRMTPSPGWSWLREGHADGPLLGGCLESMQHLRGTRYWPDLSGAILFLETSEEKPGPATVDGILMDYENMGVFDRLNGLLFGRPMRYSDEEKLQLREVILERTGRYAFPIIADMDFGHTAPLFVLPIGCSAAIDSAARTFRILDTAVS